MKSFLRDTRGNLPLTESLALKAVSILLALILWITILGLKREELQVNVKLDPLLPPGMMVVNEVPTHIRFTLIGPRVWLREATKSIAPIRPDLRHTRANNIEFAIGENLLTPIPTAVKVKDYYPQQISLQLDEVIEKEIPVRATLKGNPMPGYEVTKVILTPPKVMVSGPKHLLETEEYIGTEVFSIDDLHGTKEAEVVVEIDKSKGYQLTKDQFVQLKVLTRRVMNRN